jgi:hypothetical protein
MPDLETWQYIQDNLKVGMMIPNWTKDRGYTGEPFEVLEVTWGYIMVGIPKGVKVHHKDFTLLHKLWDGYRNGPIQRITMRNSSYRSKYVISLFHWVEEKNGSLP